MWRLKYCNFLWDVETRMVDGRDLNTLTEILTTYRACKEALVEDITVFRSLASLLADEHQLNQ